MFPKNPHSKWKIPECGFTRWQRLKQFVDNLQYIFLDTQLSNLLSLTMCIRLPSSWYLLPFTTCHHPHPVCSVSNVSKSFDFIACEKDVLWLLSLTNAELRHILRFSAICKFRFYVHLGDAFPFSSLPRLIVIFKSEHLEFHLVLRGDGNRSCRSIKMHVVAKQELSSRQLLCVLIFLV